MAPNAEYNGVRQARKYGPAPRPWAPRPWPHPPDVHVLPDPVLPSIGSGEPSQSLLLGINVNTMT